MPAAWISAGVGLYGALKGKSSSSQPTGSAAIADPFAGQRGQYQTQLASMMNNSHFTPQDPSYKWRFDQGMESTLRGAAANGLVNSGNVLGELMNYGQGAASQEYGNQFSRLSQLAGANIGSPAAAAQIQNGNNASSSAYNQQLINKGVNAVSDWANSSGSGGGTGGWLDNLIGWGGSGTTL